MREKANLGVVVIILLISILLLSCSGGRGETPTSPDLTDSGPADQVRTNNMMFWGLGEVVLDVEEGTAEVIPARTAEFTVNLTMLYNPPNDVSKFTVTVNPDDCDFPNRLIDVNFILQHPFPGTIFWGFDTRMTIFGEATTVGKHDSSVTFPAAEELRILNADGYMRWWNFNEFGPLDTLFGYTDGWISSQDFFTTFGTVNGYKYFYDGISPTEMPINPSASNRGKFIDSTVSRKTAIQFPDVASPYKFKYSIATSWQMPNPNPPSSAADFPPDANSQEAYKIVVTQDTDSSTAFYDPDTGDFGGDLVLDIEVFDWQADGDPEGEIAGLWIESQTLFPSAVELTNNPDWAPAVTGNNSVKFSGTITNVTPTAIEGQEIFVTVENTDPNTYEPPIPGFLFPDSPLAAYQLFNCSIIDSGGCPPPTVEITDCVDVTGSSKTFHWDMSDPNTPVNQLKVTVWEDDNEIQKSPGTTSHTWNGIGCGPHVFKVQVTNDCDPPASSPPAMCDFERPDTASPTVTLNCTPPNFSWSMSDDCTPANELLVEIRKDGGPWMLLPPGTTVINWNPSCPGHTFEVRVTDESGKSTTKSCKFDGPDIDPPTVNITNCPSTTGFSYTFIWNMSDDCTLTSKLKVWVKKDGGNWESRPDGSKSYTWTGICGDDHTFEVRVRDESGKEATDDCPDFDGPPRKWHIRTPDCVEDLRFTSLAIVCGVPAITCYDWDAETLYYLRAKDSLGMEWYPPEIVISGLDWNGGYPSLTVVNGRPAIACWTGDNPTNVSVENNSLLYLRSFDSCGSSWAVLTPPAPGVNGGSHCSLAVVNGNPAISFYDYNNNTLGYVRALDTNGDTWGPVEHPDSNTGTFYYTSLAVINGMPAISYIDESNDNLKYVTAKDGNGNDWQNPIAPYDYWFPGSEETGPTSLAEVCGHPAVCFVVNKAGSSSDIIFFRAWDNYGQTVDDWGSYSTVDGDDWGQFPSLAVICGNPAVSYHDYKNEVLKYVLAVDVCGDSWESPVLVDGNGYTGLYTSLVEIDCNPAISYVNATNDCVKFAIYSCW